jgi:hypothetical protein
MNAKDYQAVLSSIDQAIEVFERNPTPSGSESKAYEQLKMLRASVASALARYEQSNSSEQGHAAGR